MIIFFDFFSMISLQVLDNYEVSLTSGQSQTPPTSSSKRSRMKTLRLVDEDTKDKKKQKHKTPAKTQKTKVGCPVNVHDTKTQHRALKVRILSRSCFARH